MQLTLGDYGINIEMHDTFGKRPGLYVVNKNQALKVGNFASEEKARIFEGYIKYMVGLNDPDELWNGYKEADS